MKGDRYILVINNVRAIAALNFELGYRHRICQPIGQNIYIFTKGVDKFVIRVTM